MTTITNFHNVHHVGKNNVGAVWVRASFDGERLSIVGVVGPRRNGNCSGSSGQVVDALREEMLFAPGWDRVLVNRLADVWDRWHLNDMRAGTPAQEDCLRRHKADFPGYPESYLDWALATLKEAGLQPDGSYSYGSKWLFEAVPTDVLEFLQSLPVATTECPWSNL